MYKLYRGWMQTFGPFLVHKKAFVKKEREKS